jgi:hypothetical protein
MVDYNAGVKVGYSSDQKEQSSSTENVLQFRVLLDQGLAVDLVVLDVGIQTEDAAGSEGGD